MFVDENLYSEKKKEEKTINFAFQKVRANHELSCTKEVQYIYNTHTHTDRAISRIVTKPLYTIWPLYTIVYACGPSKKKPTEYHYAEINY